MPSSALKKEYWRKPALILHSLEYIDYGLWPFADYDDHKKWCQVTLDPIVRRNNVRCCQYGTIPKAFYLRTINFSLTLYILTRLLITELENYLISHEATILTKKNLPWILSLFVNEIKFFLKRILLTVRSECFRSSIFFYITERFSSWKYSQR